MYILNGMYFGKNYYLDVCHEYMHIVIIVYSILCLSTKLVAIIMLIQLKLNMMI